MKLYDLAKFALTVALMGATIALAAFDPVNDDTDIFLANPNISAERPNVLIVLDNTANWNQPFTNEKNALVQVVNGLTDQYNVGLMMFPETGGGNDNVDGGYVRYHVRQMTLANKTALASMVNNLIQSGPGSDVGNNATTGLALYESYLYFAGKTSVASHGKVKTDKDDTTDPLLSALPATVTSGTPPVARPNHALPAGTSADFYRSPVTDGCQRNFIIYISNGPANENASARAFTETQLGTLTGVSPPAVISITPSGQQANWGDEMAKFMANADVFATSGGVPNSSGVQNVYTYTVEIDPEAGANVINVTTAAAHGLAVNDAVTIAATTSFNGTYTVNTVNSTTQFSIVFSITPNPATEAAGTANGVNISEISQVSSDMTALLKSIAANGKGKYFGVTSSASGTAIVDALNAIFTEVQAVNSVFASTTLPVSVNVRGTNLNQVYIGVFRPDSTKSPRWLGNLKMYNLALNSATGAVFLADAANGPPPATGNPSENSTTGFVSQNSPSFWTHSSSFWGFRDATQNGPGGPSDLPDGDLVEKGGAAQRLRDEFASAESSSPARNLYTCTTGAVDGTSQDCQPSTGFQLSRTPFTTLNDAISAAALQLDTRFVSPLSAYTSQAVTSVTDRLPVPLSNTWAGANSRFVTSLSNAAVSRTINTLTTAVPKVVSSLTGIVAGTITVNITDISKSGNTYVITTDAAFTGVVDGTTVLPAIDCTAGGTSFNDFDSLSATNRTVSAHTTSAPFTYTIPGPSGNRTCSAGTVQGPGPVNSTTAQANLNAHGYIGGQSVTIQGATPVQFNGTFNITLGDINNLDPTNKFRYTMTTAGGVAAVNSPTFSAITGSGNTTTATATTDVDHGFLAGTSVDISGASDAAYNGTKTIISTPALNTFTYSVGGTAIGPNTNTSGVSALQGGGTTVTVTVSGTHFYADGQTLFISGSDVAGYNGSFVISCPTCDAVFGSTAPFTITTASVLPANTSNVVYTATATSQFVLGRAPNHGLVAADSIVIEGPAAPTGTFSVISNFGTDYWFYFDSLVASAPITSSGYTVRHETNHKAWVTISGGHGYTDGREVRIAGANPAGYDQTENIRVCPGGTGVFCTNQLNVFSYPLPALVGTNTSSAVTASIKTTTARATAVNHGFTNGSKVTIAGATPSAFNTVDAATDFTIAVVDANTFTYTLPSEQGDASGTITAAQASGSSAERDLIIRWVRGEDNFQDENSSSTTTDLRASVHGDVLHSRPAVVNYNRFSGSDDDVFIFYGGNDGIFHAVKGGYANPSGFTPNTLTPGGEAWGFVPTEFFSSFKRMRNNSPTISSSFKKPYFMDGPIGIYTSDACCLADSSPGSNGKLGDTGDVVNLYIGNRRGGRFLYALDVNDPVDPKFLWKITNSGSFSELGQTWSQPTAVTNLAGLTVPVLVFGAGYDAAVDDVNPKLIYSIDVNGHVCLDAACTGGTKISRTMGRGIYVVNALTGALIWRAGRTGSGATKEVAGMDFAIPSDITVIRNETTGVTNRAYVGDTGGNLWRIDFRSDSGAASPNLALTTVTKLASIADTTTKVTVTDPDTLSPVSVIPGLRKFLFPPDVVGQTGFDAVLIGTGDREHPFDTFVTNRFYMFKDKGTDAGPATGTTTCDPTIAEASIANASCTPDPIAGLSDLTSNCIQDLAACTAAGEDQTVVTAKLGTDRGWFITLLEGEKVVGNAISIGGTTFFNTNQPSATAGGGTCGSNLGVARQYQVGTVDATATSDLNAVGGLTGADRSLIHAGGGYLPSPVHVVVMLGGKPVEAVISGIQVSTPAGASLSARLRKFWYKEVDPTK